MTQFNPFSSEENLPAESRRQKIAIQIATIQIVSSFLTLGFFTYLIVQNASWQLYVTTGALAVFTALLFAGLQFVRKGQVLTGVRWMLAGTAAVMLLGSFLFAGMGFIIGPALVLLAAVVAFQTLQAKSAREILVIAIVLGFLSTATDFLGLEYRQTVPALRSVVPILIVLVVLAIGFFAALASRKQISSFWQSSVRNRLTGIVVGAAIIPVLFISIFLGVTTYVQVRNTLVQNIFDRLDTIEEIKTTQLSDYFTRREGDMSALSNTMGSLLSDALQKMEAINTLKRDQIHKLFEIWDADVRDVASDPGVVLGMQELTNGFQVLGPAQARDLYLGKDDLEFAGDGSGYSLAHSEQQGFFSGYTAIHGYEDAFLIDPDGNVVYSVNKTDAFATNLLTGTYKDSNLAKLYTNLVSAQTGTSYIADVASFEGEASMFIGAPIYNGSTFVGMLVYKLPVNNINAIMAERTGQGLTGESFLIALDDNGNISYRSNRTSPGNEKFVIGYDITDIASPTMRKALDGNSGGGLIAASTGETRVNAYRPLDIEGVNWAVLTSVNAAEALSPLHISGEADFLANYKKNYGYYDIFLIHPNGTVFYTVTHEADYQTNILTGEFSDTNLALLVGEILDSKSFEFSDFAYYAPSNNAPAAFFGTPVLDANGNIQLIVATQIAVEDINKIMNEAHGLGETGESYIIGPDFLGRMDSRFIDQLGVDTTVLNPDFSVDTEAVRSALEGKSGQGTITDYRGLPVMSVWKPFAVSESETSQAEDLVWAIMTEIDESEALTPINQLAGTLATIVALAALIIVALAVLVGTRLASGFVTPILDLTQTATQVAAGNLDLRVATTSTDEIGTLTNAFNTMTRQLRDLIGSLEARVAARTKDLATVAEISTATGTILDVQTLLQEVVDLSKERFGLYHSHIYLLDEAGENLVLTAGAGEPGRIMAAEKRSIPLNREQSLVARAARDGKGVIVNDVTEAPDFLPNALLPDTHAELAVPMIVGGKVIGVFDVQSETIGRFTDADISVKTTLAAQVATAIQNVRSFERSKKDAELQSLVNMIGSRIQRTTSIEETLQTAIRELGTAIGASRVQAKISTPKDGNIN